MRSTIHLVAAVVLALSAGSLGAQTSGSTFATAKSYSGTFTVDGKSQGSGIINGLQTTWTAHITAGGNLTLNTREPTSGSVVYHGTVTGTAKIDMQEVVILSPKCTMTKTINQTVDLAAGSKVDGGSPRKVTLFISGGYTLLIDPHADITVTDTYGECGAPVELSQPLGIIFRLSQGEGFPLPSSGLVLSGSSTITTIDPLGVGLLDYTENSTWQLTAVPDPLEVVITPHDYETWRPEAGQDESTPGDNPIAIDARLQYKSGEPLDTTAQQFIFQLVNVSHEPGITMNFPLRGAKSADLQFTPDANPGFTIDGDENNRATTPPGSYTEDTAVVSAFDWGAWGEIQVTAVMPDGSQIKGHLAGDDAQTSVRLPKRSADSHIADAWKQDQGVQSLPDNDDSETDPAGKADCTGDGLTLYEEYRGFMENGKHIEGNPKKKDFFIRNLIGPEAEPGIWLFTDDTGLEVHKDLQAEEFDGAYDKGAQGKDDGPFTGSRLINGNHNQGAHTTDQHGVLLATCDDWNGGESFDHWHFIGDTLQYTWYPTGICMQDRFAPGKDLTRQAQLTPLSAFFHYDTSVAHELGHSVGVQHHGDGDLTGKTFSLISPDDTSNVFGVPIFRLGGKDVVITMEDTGADIASQIWNNIQNSLDACGSLSDGDFVLPDSWQRACKDKLASPRPHLEFSFYVGMPKMQHSGNDQCIMRYKFAQLYPSATNSLAYYAVPAGTEPLGFDLCNSADGTGVNGDRKPQPRYWSATLGACQQQVCVNDGKKKGKIR